MDPHADLVAPSGAHFLRPPPRLRRPQFVAAVPVDPSGTVGPTRGQARGRQWRRTAAGLCVPTAAVFDQPAQRIVEASALAGPIGGVTGWASLHLAGARWFEE
ncbi:hypothetical protein [Nocardioides alcanivorans]|uniref:hypothetical protein n=1 Tax=Nocardioides alcanivorans TaxID=2897352 RepID=UPI001F2F1661|nr:hypothetical protein [Nocardioides alcanivorans]